MVLDVVFAALVAAVFGVWVARGIQWWRGGQHVDGVWVGAVARFTLITLKETEARRTWLGLQMPLPLTFSKDDDDRAYEHFAEPLVLRMTAAEARALARVLRAAAGRNPVRALEEERAS